MTAVEYGKLVVESQLVPPEFIEELLQLMNNSAATAEDLAYQLVANNLLSRWQAKEIEGPADAVEYPTGKGPYRVALYRTQVTLNLDDRAGWHQFDIKQVGFRRERDLSPLPFR